MPFERTSIEGVWRIKPEMKTDSRGSFHRVWDLEMLTEIGHKEPLVQHNHSVNKLKGTLRGLHYQQPPNAETRIVKCVRGAIWDVAVDLRGDSPTFLQHVATELTGGNYAMMYIPKGFAHGFITLADDTEVLYYHTAFYHPTSEGGLRFDDPALGISWPIAPTIVSDRDKSFPLLNAGFRGISL